MPLPVQKLSVAQLQSRAPDDEAAVASVIAHAFGPHGPGIILVDGLYPQYQHDRASLLAASAALATLPEHRLQPLELPHLTFSTGWSRGRESFKGVVDVNKASFYANPVYDDPAFADLALKNKYPHYMHPNVWPEDSSCADVEKYFKKVGSYMHSVGLHVAYHCDQVVKRKLGKHTAFSSLEHALRQSRAAKGRLLNFFPPSASVAQSKPEEKDHMWFGYHNDHSTLTALMCAQFYDSEDLTPLPASPDPKAGLHVCRRGSNVSEKVVIPANCLAFQLGETAQIATGGVLRATAHAVHMPQLGGKKASRTSLALFMQPNPWEVVKMPDQLTPAEREEALDTNDLVPSLRERYEPNDIFEKFAAKAAKVYSA